MVASPVGTVALMRFYLAKVVRNRPTIKGGELENRLGYTFREHLSNIE